MSKILLYCTKAKPILRDYRDKAIYDRFVISPTDRPFTSDDTQPILNGKIVAECDFEVEELRLDNDDPLGAYWYETETLNKYEVLEKSCLTDDELFDYLGEYNEGYAIHIKNLHIFDKPKELSNYCIKQCQFSKCSTCKYGKNNISCATIDTPITKAPQNMMYAYDNELNKYILISIRPEWLCKILNGEKTIEVRKKVLKEMLGNEAVERIEVKEDE